MVSHDCISVCAAGFRVRLSTSARRFLRLDVGEVRQPGDAEQEQQGDGRNGDSEDGAHQAALAASPCGTSHDRRQRGALVVT